MSDFLILRRTGPEPTDLEVVNLIQDKGGDEGEQAIREGARGSAGRYLAVSMGNVTEREMNLEPVLSKPHDEPVESEQIPQG
jgi:hypothetical protein